MNDVKNISATMTSQLTGAMKKNMDMNMQMTFNIRLPIVLLFDDIQVQTKTGNFFVNQEMKATLILMTERFDNIDSAAIISDTLPCLHCR